MEFTTGQRMRAVVLLVTNEAVDTRYSALHLNVDEIAARHLMDEMVEEGIGLWNHDATILRFDYTLRWKQ
jgi:hypothetical protein